MCVLVPPALAVSREGHDFHTISLTKNLFKWFAIHAPSHPQITSLKQISRFISFHPRETKYFFLVLVFQWEEMLTLDSGCII